MKYFLVGIKGSGMAALAQILLDRKIEVVGSDTDRYVFTQEELERRGVTIYNFNQYGLKDIDLVIYGHSYKESIEVEKAKKMNIETIEYHMFVSSILKEKYSIAVCGSHGKTSSVGILSNILKRFNPSYLRGDGMGKWTDSKYFIFEACEYQNHFLVYEPNEIIVLNIDYDHNDYFKSKYSYKNAFKNFIKRAKNRVYLNDKIKGIRGKNIFKFGENSFCFTDIKTNEKDTIFYIDFKDFVIKDIKVKTQHPMLINNILGLILCALYLGANEDDIKNNISSVGVKRRSQEIIIKDDVIIDDYAHHPTQMQVMIEEAKLRYPDKKIVAIFQPDRYSRIKQFHRKIKKVLSTTERSFILPFPNMIKNDTKYNFDASIIGIDVYEDIDELLSELMMFSNCVYLFFSSKDLGVIERKLIESKKKLT